MPSAATTAAETNQSEVILAGTARAGIARAATIGTGRVPADADPILAQSAYFSVYAAAEPGVMPRVLELFARRGLVPSGWRSTAAGNDRNQPNGLAIEIEMRGLGSETADHIAACLRQIACVEAVSNSWRAAGAG
ncbi:MAG TPA: hypothetical protein VMF05_09790 [Stellaceae bacterium]|nr:hypothetical protein [Stellaceae bacterium]